tara:strand:+ start:199294 stop:199971 length:678 start_codon:yes stop_codon:yes gene_type:complete
MANHPADQPVQIPTGAQWAGHIRSLIRQPLSAVPFDQSDSKRASYIESFTDEYGNRRATDQPFLGYLLEVEFEAQSPPEALDQRLWWMIQSGKYDEVRIASLIEPKDALVHESASLAIEYRTMVELCALHALWVIANRLGSDRLIDRCLNAAAWHTRELQPDNAINRPWATQVFIALAQQGDDAETRHLAHLHAQTLIHNSSISFGTPDILSALILKDVVDQLVG